MMKHGPVTSLNALATLLGLGGAIGLGIGRFAYALILPEMRADLGWSFAEAGWMNAVNAVGHLAGALVTAGLASRFGLWPVSMAGVLMTILALTATGLTDVFAWLSTWRLLTGVGGALAFVSGAAIVADLATDQPTSRGRAFALYYAGIGLGIVVSGFFVRPFLETVGGENWRYVWIGLGYITLMLGFVMLLARRGALVASSPASTAPPVRLMPHALLLAGCFFFGVGNMGYMTFAFALLGGGSATTGQTLVFWSALGLAAIISPLLWSGLINRSLNGSAIAILSGVTLLGAALPVLSTAFPVALISAALFGSSFFAVVAAITAYISRNLPRHAWTGLLGIVSVAFGLGHAAGPIIVGALGDAAADLGTGLSAAVAALAVSTVLTSLQRDHDAAP